nr:MAG TPA: hypothetical protein [Caudoviricetes sp.]
MKNLKAINMTESNFEKELKDLFKKYNIESDKKVQQFTNEEKTKEEVVDLAIAVEHKGRSYVVEHINIYDNEEDPRAPYNSYYNEYYQLYINGRRASGASDFDWFKYNMSNDYQIVPKIVQETLIKNICDEEIKIVEYYRNQG